MSLTGEDYAAMREAKQRHKERRAAINLPIIEASGIPFEYKASTVLFREPGMPQVNFWPSTDKWHVCGTNESRNGDAVALLRWYTSLRPTQSAKPEPDVTEDLGTRHECTCNRCTTEVIV